MNSLPLAVIDGEPRIDSRLIANQLGVEHKNTRELIQQYQVDFEEFGVCPFETAKPTQGSLGGRPEKFALLNEDQAYLLLTYCQNTEQARTLKKRLVMSFAEHRKALGQPAPSLDLATLSTHALRELATEIEKNAALQSRVIVMQPKADFFDHVVGSETLFDRDEAAKMLRTGPRRLWDALREWQVVQAGGQPYQKYYDLGYFRLVPTLIDKGSYKVPYQQVMITAKGLTWLKALMDSNIMPSKALTVAGGAV
jgi:phage antirepressor YoqD-like protein